MLLRRTDGHAIRPTSTGAAVPVFCTICLLGVLAVAFFPSAKGPFTASYGPATAFSSLKNVQRLELSIVVAQQTSVVRLFPVRFYLPIGPGIAVFLKPNHPSANTLPLLC
jgi:hypothetical protein